MKTGNLTTETSSVLSPLVSFVRFVGNLFRLRRAQRRGRDNPFTEINQIKIKMKTALQSVQQAVDDANAKFDEFCQDIVDLRKLNTDLQTALDGQTNDPDLQAAADKLEAKILEVNKKINPTPVDQTGATPATTAGTAS